MQETKQVKYPLGSVASNWEFCKTAATCTFGNSKCMIDGTLSLAFLKDDFRYKNEIQIQVFSAEHKIIRRACNSGKWDRVEVYIPADQLDNIISTLTRIKTLINDPQK